MNKFLGCLLFSALTAGAATAPNTVLTASGNVAAAGVVATLTNQSVIGYTIILDGTAVATSTITVAVQVYNPGSQSYVTPIGIGQPNNADPITITNGTAQVVQVPGAYPGIQVKVISYGTATGTFRAVITAY